MTGMKDNQLSLPAWLQGKTHAGKTIGRRFRPHARTVTVPNLRSYYVPPCTTCEAVGAGGKMLGHFTVVCGVKPAAFQCSSSTGLEVQSVPNNIPDDPYLLLAAGKPDVEDW